MAKFLNWTEIPFADREDVTDPYPAPDFSEEGADYSVLSRCALMEAVIERNIQLFWSEGVFPEDEGLGRETYLRKKPTIFRMRRRHHHGTSEDLEYYGIGETVPDAYTARLFAGRKDPNYPESDFSLSMAYAIGPAVRLLRNIPFGGDVFPWIAGHDLEDEELDDVELDDYATHKDTIPSELIQVVDDGYVEELGGFVNPVKMFPEQLFFNPARVFPHMHTTLFQSISSDTLKDGSYSFQYNNKGAMAGLSFARWGAVGTGMDDFMHSYEYKDDVAGSSFASCVSQLLSNPLIVPTQSTTRAWRPGGTILMHGLSALGLYNPNLSPAYRMSRVQIIGSSTGNDLLVYKLTLDSEIARLVKSVKILLLQEARIDARNNTGTSVYDEIHKFTDRKFFVKDMVKIGTTWSLANSARHLQYHQAATYIDDLMTPVALDLQAHPGTTNGASVDLWAMQYVVGMIIEWNFKSFV